MRMNEQDVDRQGVGLFIAFEEPRIPAMAQAVLDSGWCNGECTLAELKQLFQDRGLGAANVFNFFRYADALKNAEEGDRDD
jgi:hypothetical protein